MSKKLQVLRRFDDMVYKTKNGKTFKQSKIWNYENIWKTFLISDTHFFHRKIGKWCGRPNNWQDLIIQRWNQVVGHDDVVIHLGDFTFGNKKITKELVDNLNGKIYLIKGNHDRRSAGWFDDVGVSLIKKGFIVNCPDRDMKLLFTHKPVMEIPQDVTVIHGHWHEKSPHIRLNYINTSVEVIDYRPTRVMDVMIKRDDLQMMKIAV